MTSRIILLAEDNPRDEELTLRALKKSGIVNPVIVLRDGVRILGLYWLVLNEVAAPTARP